MPHLFPEAIIEVLLLLAATHCKLGDYCSFLLHDITLTDGPVPFFDRPAMEV
jgi:hypothetical protein